MIHEGKVAAPKRLHAEISD